MKKSIFKIVLAVLALVIIAAAWIALRTPSSPFDDESATIEPSAQLIQKGEYIARLGDCVACHSMPDRKPFTGGLEMATPLGSIYTTNITPDDETGIGQYTLADFDRAVRHGVAKDGHRLYPAMPYPSYVKYSDEDIKALYAFFMHGVKPERALNKTSEIPWPLNMRWPLAYWNVVFQPSGTYQDKPDHDEQWNRGAYLVQGPGHCGSCHTPRGLAMNEKAYDESDPQFLAGALLDGWYAPSLRNDMNTGLGRWTEEDVYQYLKNGRNDHAVVFGSMTEAFNNSTQFMTNDDLHAIAHYLKSLPGHADEGEPWQYNDESNNALSLENRVDNPGAQIYMARCSSCHGNDGRGQGPWIPPLAGATSMMISDDSSAINVTLNGSNRIIAGGVPDAYRMPPFRKHLSDKEMAAVLSFIRTSWGNTGGKVDEQAVKELRKRTDPASSEPIVLQMR